LQIKSLPLHVLQHKCCLELDRRANQLAHHLQDLDIGPDVLVGICVERSLEMVVGLLGTLKAGGAYVPLDPTYPAERLAFMLSDSQVPVLLTQQHLLDNLPDYKGHVISLDTDWEVVARKSWENPRSIVKTENLAYVIYTSGSTGKPKGCMVTHYNVTRLYEATQNWYQFDKDDVWTLFHSYAFDFSVWEIWGALLNGGRLVVVPYLISRSPEQFYELVRRAQGSRLLFLTKPPLPSSNSYGQKKHLVLYLTWPCVLLFLAVRVLIYKV